jgi:hypothetical protein
LDRVNDLQAFHGGYLAQVLIRSGHCRRDTAPMQFQCYRQLKSIQGS